jgi:hypothetical protein
MNREKEWRKFERFILDDCVGNGCDEPLRWMDDGVGEYVSIVRLDEADWKRFPNVLAKHPVAALFTEDDQGFKDIDLIETEDALAEIIAEAEAEAEDYDE